MQKFLCLILLQLKCREEPVVRNVMPDVKLPEKNVSDSMPCKTETKSAESAKAEIKPKRLPEPFEIKGSLQMVKEDKVRYEAVTKSEPPKQMNLLRISSLMRTAVTNTES